MKTYLEFITEVYGLILNLEGLAEMAARTQDPRGQKIAEKTFLELLQKDLEKKGNKGVIDRFREMTDLELKTITRGRYQIVYDDY